MASAKAKRPTVVLVAAILLFIFGGYALLSGFCGGVMQALMPVIFGMLPPPPAQGQPDLWMSFRLIEDISKEAPGYVAMTIAASVCRFILGVLAVVAGVGALGLKPRARTLGMAVAFGFIGLNIAADAYGALVVLPVTTRLQQKQLRMMPQAPNPQMEELVGTGTTVFSLVLMGAALAFSIGIWLTVFFLLKRKTSRDAFAGIVAVPPPLEDEERRSRYSGYDDDDAGPPDTGITDRPKR